MRLAAIGELHLGSGAAMRTSDEKHDRDVLRSVGNGGGGGLVDEDAIPETFDGEGGVDRMGFVFRDGPGKDVACAWRGLEPAGAPTAVHVEAGNGSLGDDWGAIRRHINDATPIAQHS